MQTQHQKFKIKIEVVSLFNCFIKAYTRKLLTKQDYRYILEELQKFPKLTNQLIKFTNERLQQCNNATMEQ